MEDLAIYEDAANHIQGQFELAKIVVGEGDEWMNKLRAILSDKIEYLIEKDPEKLKWVLYRIDVNEKEVMNVIANSPLFEAVEAIAQMIIDRQIEKAITRKKYSTGKADLSFEM